MDLPAWQACQLFPVQEAKLAQVLQSPDGGANVTSSLEIFLLSVSGYLLQCLHKLAGLFGTSNVECVGLPPGHIRLMVLL